MSYTLIDETTSISGTATVISYIPNSFKYNEISIKSISFLDAGGNPIVPTTGTLLAFMIPDAEQVGVKSNHFWKGMYSTEWFDTISVAQFNSNTGFFFSYLLPPDFLGITFVGVNSEVKSVRVRWYAFK